MRSPSKENAQKMLSVDYDEHTTDDALISAQILQKLQSNTSLEGVHLYSPHADLSNIFQVLPALQNLTRLTLFNTFRMTSMEVACLAKVFEVSRTLTSVTVCGHEFNYQNVRTIAMGLQCNTSISTLDLRGNMIKPSSACFLSNVLLLNSTITSLNLSANSLGDQGMIHLSSTLAHHRTLRHLDVGLNHFRVKGAQALSSALKTNRALKVLRLGHNEIGEQGADFLATALHVNSTLTTLNLTSCNIGCTGTRSLAKALKVNRTLSTLVLTANKMRTRGIHALSRALEENATLTHLSLDSNMGIGMHYDSSLAPMLSKNSTLVHLDICVTGMNDVGEAQIMKALETNTTLRGLSTTSWNRSQLAEYLDRNKMIFTEACMDMLGLGAVRQVSYPSEDRDVVRMIARFITTNPANAATP